jgi:hypothetical protein
MLGSDPEIEHGGVYPEVLQMSALGTTDGSHGAVGEGAATSAASVGFESRSVGSE